MIALKAKGVFTILIVLKHRYLTLKATGVLTILVALR